MGGRGLTGWRHLLVLVLVVPLALSSALPVFARVLGRPVAHVCQCQLHGGHSDCQCPMCNQHRDRTIVTIRERCGDDDLVFGGSLDSAIAPSAAAGVSAPEGIRVALAKPLARLTSTVRTPPIPPPRRAAS